MVNKSGPRTEPWKHQQNKVYSLLEQWEPNRTAWDLPVRYDWTHMRAEPEKPKLYGNLRRSKEWSMLIHCLSCQLQETWHLISYLVQLSRYHLTYRYLNNLKRLMTRPARVNSKLFNIMTTHDDHKTNTNIWLPYGVCSLVSGSR